MKKAEAVLRFPRLARARARISTSMRKTNVHLGMLSE